MFVCERKKETEGFRAGGSEGEYVCLCVGGGEKRVVRRERMYMCMYVCVCLRGEVWRQRGTVSILF